MSSPFLSPRVVGTRASIGWYFATGSTGICETVRFLEVPHTLGLKLVEVFGIYVTAGALASVVYETSHLAFAVTSNKPTYRKKKFF